MAGDGKARRSSWILVYGPRGSKPRAPGERGDDGELTATNYGGEERTKAGTVSNSDGGAPVNDGDMV